MPDKAIFLSGLFLKIVFFKVMRIENSLYFIFGDAANLLI
ncbi:hypothetical protein ECP03023084_4054 [Escherichia coli P0302308.4]|uniref:Uncharacterized protein n=1 Tax=Escherichia coli TaxID=562 RepID=A0A6G6AML6_ECOLX|nr:hypothetical protein STBHUCCB_p1360 [Salmonella enterica subsp. enterica serovar Typhi str. P-stx-12]AVJ74736.1 hypothetical protein CSC06_4445 [Escherichia coli]EMW31797.1 hypothetical protein EC2785200_4132 [Escherichia coli 2785200]EMX06691.1 hypothetical protein ECP03023081_2173 [Escherichia coli P0302308.1]ENA24863.1 hypothetical protein EC2016001_0746 [Escherichia coli 201600.1]ENC95233.1 hypothetical protein ECP030230810_4795 [Escherichia coli P0302308.10]ENC99264.1 hypothetical pro